jgi:hypothetical protein
MQEQANIVKNTTIPHSSPDVTSSASGYTASEKTLEKQIQNGVVEARRSMSQRLVRKMNAGQLKNRDMRHQFPTPNKGGQLNTERPCARCGNPMIVAPGQIMLSHKECRKGLRRSK